MTNPNWGLMGGNNALAMFQFGANLGQQALASQEERALKEAVGAYATNPNDPNALAGVMKADPRLGMQFQQRQQQTQAAQQEAQRGRVKEIARLFDGISDEQTYQQRIGLAQRMGIDTTGVPANYDPAWVQDNALIMRFAAEKPEALSTFGKIATDEGLQPGTPAFNARVTDLVKADAIKTIPYTQGGGVAGYNPLTGQTNTIVAPNPGGFAAGTPVTSPPSAGSPPPSAVDYLRKNPGLKAQFDAKYGAGAADRALGGQPGGNGPFGQ